MNSTSPPRRCCNNFNGQRQQPIHDRSDALTFMSTVYTLLAAPVGTPEYAAPPAGAGLAPVKRENCCDSMLEATDDAMPPILSLAALLHLV